MISDSELRDFHRRRLEILRDSGADMFLMETIPAYREAAVLADLGLLPFHTKKRISPIRGKQHPRIPHPIDPLSADDSY